MLTVIPDPGPRAGKTWIGLVRTVPGARRYPLGYSEGALYSLEYLERRQGPAPYPEAWRTFYVPISD